MRPLQSSHLFGLALRLLMVAVCVLPFTSARQVAVAVGSLPVSLAQLPAGPVEEEEHERSGSQESSERLASDRATVSRDRLSTGRLRLPVPRTCALAASTTHLSARSTAADPYNNGLGTHFRC